MGLAGVRNFQDPCRKCGSRTVHSPESPFCEDILEAKKEGYIEGLRAYAWWKDGVEYVGSCGTTLKQAIDRYKP